MVCSHYAFNTVQIVTEIESPDRSQTRAIEDSVELKDPTLTRHVRFDSRYNWKCEGCSHRIECDKYLIDEISLPKDKRRWWDVYEKRSLIVPKWFKKTTKTMM
jgi:hypothetical protein